MNHLVEIQKEKEICKNDMTKEKMSDKEFIYNFHEFQLDLNKYTPYPP